ncbi:MAG: exodeoxyribonuclease VII large subunit [Chlorobi bacterium]|nr:exodeoxyribonuclease VII large subunit [Chlorobiota bacterium]
MAEDFLTLYELNSRIKDSINNSFPDTYWVIAEISELNINTRSGHCYLELIEKKEKSETLKAKSRATIWNFTYRMLKPYFESTTGKTLSSGIKVLVKVLVEFHEVYSSSLNILDIDPSYTIGDLAVKKQEIINQLNEEGIINMNKELEIPLVPQKIAIISSKTAAGYGDFMNQIQNNEFNYAFYTRLFQANMQGEKAEESIINALEQIYNYEDFFDLVVIIRGGGSKMDLACFDSYWLSYHITQFPIPVITGIGHERDDTIADMVAHTKLKTPTAVAEFIISTIYEFDVVLNKYQNRFFEQASTLIEEEKQWLITNLHNFQNLTFSTIQNSKNNLSIYTLKTGSIVNKKIIQNKNTLKNKVQHLKNSFLKQWFKKNQELDLLHSKTPQTIKKLFQNKENKLAIYSKTIELTNPLEILKRGYSLTHYNGKLIKSIDEISVDSQIETQLYDGKIESTVVKKKKISQASSKNE